MELRNIADLLDGLLEKEEIGVEVIDLQTIRPLDRETIIRSVKKTTEYSEKSEADALVIKGKQEILCYPVRSRVERQLEQLKQLFFWANALVGFEDKKD